MKLSRVFKVLMILLVVLFFCENVYSEDWVKYQRKIDINNDGTIDEAEYFTIDLWGKLTEKTYFTDTGKTRGICYYTYDQNGNEIRIDIDEGHDGTIDTVIYSIWREN